ncbi:hypothetical protein [Bifidobacterium olomucense]|uniref:hypothetical protein n=1 Tax=Bifidobacterium olomucense TaxID=2675324 RepID=UPI00145E9E37|nr:hypothetical protein [Bifidobacterium sp. DSM 109959]
MSRAHDPQECVYFVKLSCRRGYLDRKVDVPPQNHDFQNVEIPGDTPRVARETNLSIFITRCKEHFNS